MEIGVVRQIDIQEELKASYLDYAMSVIVARALPDVRDGLKPVHRRILYAMNEMGMRHDRPYKKSARIVGEVLGKYHPHGDAAVYDAMARMAQDFSMRYPLVDGQGNFGSIDGDRPAAMRYTEARLEELAEEILADLDKDTVDFVPNFDDTLQEPSVLPAKVPHLLLNGASGIAVGMATNIPPHNLSEICDAVSYIVDHYGELDEISVDDLLGIVQGPDFPTGGTIVGTEGIRNAYATGRGRLVVRAKIHFEDLKGNRTAIVVTELPYQVNKSNLIEKIADLARSHRIDAISDLRDESDRMGLRIIIELKRGAQPQPALNQLLKYTLLQNTFGVNMLALVDGQPRLLSLKRVLVHYVEHRQEVITRRSRHELEIAKRRAHILEGLNIALDHLDEVIQIIRRSRTADNAKENLRRKLKLTDVQAQAILDMQLRRLAALERKKIEDEYVEVIKRIAYLEDLLANPRKVLSLIQEDLSHIRARYGDARRTRITAEEAAELRAEDLIPDEYILISITGRGYIKRVPAATYRSQHRGGRGILGMTTRDHDSVRHLFHANTLDNILFFSRLGKVYQEQAHRIPDASRQARGIPLVNLISLESNRERITAAIAVPREAEGKYLAMLTRRGKIKRVAVKEFEAVRPSGLIAMSLDEGDELRWVDLTSGDDDLVVVTEMGQAIRFHETQVRSMGRAAGGVFAIKLSEGDRVATADVVRDGGDLLVVTERGYGKRSSMSQYPAQRRGGSGVLTIDAQRLDEVGRIVDARVVAEPDEITLISARGKVIRSKIKDLPRKGRATKGMIVMNLSEGDQLVSLARLDGTSGRKTKGGTRGSDDASLDDGRGSKASRGSSARGWKKASGKGRAGVGKNFRSKRDE